MGDGLNRRELLKRGAIAGVVWATPAVQGVSMLTSTAQAVSGNGEACPVQLRLLDTNCVGDLFSAGNAVWQLTNTGPDTVYFSYSFSGCSHSTQGFSSAIGPGGSAIIQSEFVILPCVLQINVNVYPCADHPSGCDPICTLQSSTDFPNCSPPPL